MHPFKRQYIIAAVILSIFAAMAAIGGVSSGEFGIGLAVIPLSAAALALFPIFWGGGILCNPRLAIGIAAGLAVGISGGEPVGAVPGQARSHGQFLQQRDDHS